MAAVVDGRSSSEVWLTDLYHERYTSLVRLATLLVDDATLAEEIVQDAFVATARRRSSGATWEDAKSPAYLRSAVLNGARSALRKRRVRRLHLRSGPPPETAAGADESALLSAEADRVMKALATLPVRQRQVLVLRYYEDLTEAEIADALDISSGSVKTHAHRGLSALAPILEDRDDDREVR